LFAYLWDRIHLELTYEGLKERTIQGRSGLGSDLELTYEGLKVAAMFKLCSYLNNLELTYEGLKED